MTASAGVAAAADQGLAGAAGGEAAGTRAAIVIVGRDPGAREILHRELSKQYGADYQIAACDRPGMLAPWMRDLRAAGLPVALVIAGIDPLDPDGIEVLAAVRAIDPTALRVAAVGCGCWQSVRSVFDAVTLGTVGHYDHEAIGGLSVADGRCVGIARYVRDFSDPQSAEIAVTILDDWQGRGLATELLARLFDRARQAGIDRFSGLAGAENVAMARLLRKMGACLVGRGPGRVEYQVALVIPPGDPGYDQMPQPVSQPC